MTLHDNNNSPEAPLNLNAVFNGRMIIECTSPCDRACELVKKQLPRGFGNFRLNPTELEIRHHPTDDRPKIWQKWWANRIEGDSGPWSPPFGLTMVLRDRV